MFSTRSPEPLWPFVQRVVRTEQDMADATLAQSAEPAADRAFSESGLAQPFMVTTITPALR